MSCNYLDIKNEIFFNNVKKKTEKKNNKQEIKDFSISSNKYTHRSGMKVEILEYEIKD